MRTAFIIGAVVSREPDAKPPEDTLPTEALIPDAAVIVRPRAVASCIGGGFIIAGRHAGTYRLIVQAPGFQTRTLSVNVRSRKGEAAKPVRVIVALKPAVASAKPARASAG